MALPTMRIVGNLVSDPELRFTPSGVAVASFRIASTERKKTPEGSWVDGAYVFQTVKAWRQLAENIAESLQKGDRVIVFGRLRQDEYQSKEGEKRTSFELEADEVGPALSRAAAPVARTVRAKPSSSDPDPWATATEAGF